MLKSLSQTTQSPVSSPRFHYAHLSRSTPSSPPSRRSSKSAPQPIICLPNTSKTVQYVDAGTQWSPIMNVKQESDPEPQVKELQIKQEPVAPIIVPAPRPPTAKPILGAESPSTKRRQSRADSSSMSNAQTLPTKRVKSAEEETKYLPLKYEFCDVEDMVVLIANMISELIQTNDSLPLRSGVLTRFHSRTPPGISVLDYLQRLAKHATLTPPLLLSMVYYIDRLCLLYPAFTINTLTVHRFLITAATVAAKGLSDSFWNNATYARVGGIKIAELGLLELDFLYRVDWKIVPNPETLEDYYRGLVERSPGYEIDADLESESSLEDAEEEHEDKEEAVDQNIQPKSDPSSTTGRATEAKWQEWMDNVSTKKSEMGTEATRP